jgi:DNA transformation protein
MGVTGDKLTNDSGLAATLLVEKIQSIGGISSKKMFGGYGIFHDGRMFGMVDSKGQYFLKSDDTTKALFEEAGATRHGKMPYYSIPAVVFDATTQLLIWVQKAIHISK